MMGSKQMGQILESSINDILRQNYSEDRKDRQLVLITLHKTICNIKTGVTQNIYKELGGF